MKQKILLLGVSGMLGSMLLDVFASEDDFVLSATTRKENNETLKKVYPNVDFLTFDAENTTIEETSSILSGVDWVINAIGIINSYIHDDNSEEIKRAVQINALFPHSLAKAASQTGSKIIQIATDCVYRCDKGKYSETDPQDAIDIYGKTKSIGEAHSSSMYHLRCSIIGPEKASHLSLHDWFLNQPQNAIVNGYQNHIWNGVTTLHFAKICLGLVRNDIKINHIQHIIPADIITKYDLLKLFSDDYGRSDITINPLNTPNVIDRTLVTNNQNLNEAIWQAAGYKNIPSIPEMVSELSQYKFKGGE